MKEIEWMDQNTMEGRHDIYKRIMKAWMLERVLIFRKVMVG